MTAMLLLMVAIGFTMGTVGAADLGIDKTADKTGDKTGEVTLVVNGSSQTTQNGVNVILAIDSSGSMDWNDPNNARKTAANGFIDNLNPSIDKVGVVNWDNDINQPQPLTNNLQLAKDTVNAGQASGSTNINLAIETSVNLLSASTLPSAQQFIILLSDGEWNTGSDPLANGEGVDQAATAGVKIFTIFLGGSGSNTMQSIATETGGKYYVASDPDVLDDIYDQIFSEITTTGTNLVVADTIANPFSYVDGSATKVPSTIVKNADGTTTLTWNIPSLGADESWNVTYGVISSAFGLNLPTNTIATLSYLDPAGEQQTQTFPVPVLSFPEPVIPEDPVVEPEDPVVEPKTEAKTVPMQTTGAPLALLLAGALAIFGGIVLRR